MHTSAKGECMHTSLGAKDVLVPLVPGGSGVPHLLACP
jgi:hypothetical protein